MWYAVYEVATGRLVSTGTSIANPLPAGLASKEYRDNIQSPGLKWNTTTLDFDVVPIPKSKDMTEEFKRKMTKAERVKLIEAAKTDPDIAEYLDRLNTNQVIDLDSTETDEDMDLLVTKAVITSDRKADLIAETTRAVKL